jgi:hypothetical protein
MTKQPALIAARPTTSHADVILSRDKQNVELVVLRPEVTSAPTGKPQVYVPAKNPGVAVLMSFFLPGAGSLYAGSTAAGARWKGLRPGVLLPIQGVTSETRSGDRNVTALFEPGSVLENSVPLNGERAGYSPRLGKSGPVCA